MRDSTVRKSHPTQGRFCCTLRPEVRPGIVATPPCVSKHRGPRRDRADNDDSECLQAPADSDDEYFGVYFVIVHILAAAALAYLVVLAWRCCLKPRTHYFIEVPRRTARQVDAGRHLHALWKVS